MAPAPSARPYKDFYVPALHRRFTKSFWYTCVLLYAISISMGDLSLWTLVPVGVTGVRALLLSIPALLVYLIRVEQWHFGQRNTKSPSTTFWTHGLTRRSLFTLAAYWLSAFFYVEVYIWSRGVKSNLQATVAGKLHERTKMNERPMFLRFVFLFLSLAQTFVHVWHDYDQVRVSRQQTGQVAKDPRQQLLAKLMRIAPKAGITATVTFSTALFCWVVLGFRHQYWELYFFCMRSFVSLGKSPKPSGLHPFFYLVCSALIQGGFLLVLWNFCNAAFDIFMAQEPLKKGKPITSDSKDPDGSLLNGLKSKKDANKTTAFWELALITERFPERRKTIYADLDRKKGAMHQQVTAICLAELRQLIDRVKRATDPGYQSEQEKSDTKDHPIELVKRIAVPPKETSVMGPQQPPKTKMEHLGSVTRALARTNSSPQNVNDAWAKAVIERGSDKATQLHTDAEASWENGKSKLASSSVGWFFRASLRRTANVAVFGVPYSRKFLLSNAITALTNLAVLSFDEDQKGQFQNEVPEIVRVFSAAIKAIQAYTQSLTPSRTDAETLALPEAERRKVPEVEETVTELKDGLERVLGKFSEYLVNMGLSRTELQEAKELVGKGEEMRMAGGSRRAWS